ncbi:hypothetical protein [Liberibacter crescens]|uniref:hypothetical protein n=1 Tax=Liberibacter crescens TaxID=1273132 RepID=UPI0005A015AC|nr:hypothetical protein [Liberibacter crescens]AMC12652.1 hypothetical protein RL73_02590 [Liberibacter crescens]
MSNTAEKRESYDRTNDHEVRITLLERGLENIDKRFDKLEAKIDTSIAALSKEIAAVNTNLSAKIEVQGKEIAEIKGKILGIEGKLTNIPTTIQIVTIIFVVMGASFTLLRFGAPFLGH